ncbi:MAG TPA: carboxypeptidase-like regulatory domain-containing protein, partial [Terriglobales bacterium]|nr:carboxypeptidase-like regulatory domain-containing protein [Terriglobales bacterium]
MRTCCRLITPLLTLFLASLAFGQATGLITGTVRDSTGAVIQGATVVIRDIGKGADLTTVTNAEGNYLVA